MPTQDKTTKDFAALASAHGGVSVPADSVDFTQNTGGEGLYRMGSYDFDQGNVTKPEIQVPFSKVPKALKAGYKLHPDEKPRYQKDFKYQGQGPTLMERADSGIQKALTPIPNETDKDVIAHHGVGNTERALGRVFYNAPAYARDVWDAYHESLQTGNANKLLDLIDPTQIPEQLVNQFQMDWKKDHHLAVQNLTGTALGLAALGKAVHGTGKALATTVADPSALHNIDPKVIVGEGKARPVEAEAAAEGTRSVAGRIPAQSQDPTANLGRPVSPVPVEAAANISKISGPLNVSQIEKLKADAVGMKPRPHTLPVIPPPMRLGSGIAPASPAPPSQSLSDQGPQAAIDAYKKQFPNSKLTDAEIGQAAPRNQDQKDVMLHGLYSINPELADAYVKSHPEARKVFDRLRDKLASKEDSNADAGRHSGVTEGREGDVTRGAGIAAATDLSGGEGRADAGREPALQPGSTPAQPQDLDIPLVNAARTSEGKLKLGADPAALGKILGSSLYKSEGAKVITKELVQNAMDAVRESTGDKNVTVEFFNGTYGIPPTGKVVEHPDVNYYYAIQNPDGTYHVDPDNPGSPKKFPWVGNANETLNKLWPPQKGEKAIRISDTGKGMTKNELETVFTDLGASGKRDLEEASGGFGLAKAAPLMMSKQLNVSTVVNENGQLMRHSFTATPEDLLGAGVDIKSEVLPPNSAPTGTTVTSILPQDAEMYGARGFVNLSSLSLRPPGKLKFMQNGDELNPNKRDAIPPTPVGTAEIPGAKLDLYTSGKEANDPTSRYGGLSVEIHNNGIYQFGINNNIPEGVRGLPTRVAIDVRATVPEGHPDYPFTANRETLRGDKIEQAIRAFVKEKVTDPIVKAHQDRIADMYWQFPMMMGYIPVFDSGSRLTPEELETIISNPVINEIGESILDLAAEARKLLEEAGKKDWRLDGYGAKTKRIGIVLSKEVHGVHITNPKDKSHATIFINPFDDPDRGPDEIASLVWNTIKHEFVHDNVSGHTEEFSTGEKNVARALGARMEIKALTELRNKYADPNDLTRVRPEFDRAFQLYKDSRGRPETAPDIFRGEESRTDMDQPGGKGIDLGGVQLGGKGTVPVDATAGLTHQTETPQFKAWFGNSKVVDEQGKPLVVYHGTRASEDFSEFSVDGPVQDEDSEEVSTSGSGADPTSFLGAHFAKEPHVANKFATHSENWMKSRYEAGEEKPRIMPVYLSLQNPKDFGSEHNLRDFIYSGKSSGYAADALTAEAMDADGLDPDDFDDPKVEEWNDKYENDPEFRAEQNQWILEHAEQDDTLNEFAQDLANDAHSRLSQQGHDGVIYKNEVEGGTSYIAFRPEQVKSSIGNSGAFDPSTSDITANLKYKAALFNLVYKAPAASPEKIAEATKERDQLGTYIAQQGMMPPRHSAERAAWDKKIDPLLRLYENAESRIKAHENGIGEIHDLANGARVLFLNRAGLNALYVGISGVDPNVTLNGVSITKTQLPDVIHNLNVAQPPMWEEVKDVLWRAMDKDDGSVTVSTPRTEGMSRREWLGILYEELFHHAEKKLPLTPEQHLELSGNIPPALNDHLVQTYPHMKDDGTAHRAERRVREAVAHLAAGSPSQYGISQTEFAAFWFQYLDALEKTHGPKALDTLQGLALEARKGRREFTNAKGIGQQNPNAGGPVEGGAGDGGDNRGLQERGEASSGGTGPESGRGIQQATGGEVQPDSGKAQAGIEPQASLKAGEPQDNGTVVRAENNGVQLVDAEFTNLDDPDEFYYHVTTLATARKILKSGEFRPGLKQTMAQGAYRDYSRGKVFFADRNGVSYWQERIQQHLEHESDDEIPPLVVLRVPKSAVGDLQVDKLGSDDSTAHSWYSTSPVKAKESKAIAPKRLSISDIQKLKDEAEQHNPSMNVTRQQAMETNVSVDLPKTPEFAEAVKNTPGAEITKDGLVLKVVRYQQDDQAGDQSVRTGVFYLPEASRYTPYYKKATLGYGGKHKIGGETLVRRPIFVKGQTGGKAPEMAYDAIKGKGAMKKLDSAVSGVVNEQWWMSKQDPKLYLERVENLLTDHGADPNIAWKIIRHSTKGNQLRYALQENIIAHAVRDAGYDAVLGYSKGKSGPFIAELFDVREQTYPAENYLSEIHDKFTANITSKPKLSELMEEAKSRDPRLNPVDATANLTYNAADDDQPFYLKSERAIAKMGKNPMPKQSAMNFLIKNGVSKEEMYWTGLDELLKGPGTITAEEIRKHQADNDIQVKEVAHGHDAPLSALQKERGKLYAENNKLGHQMFRLAPNTESLHELLDAIDSGELAKANALIDQFAKHGRWHDEWRVDAQRFIDTSIRLKELDNQLKQAPRTTPTKYDRGSLVTPGGENQRELLVTLPHRETPLTYPKPITEFPDDYTISRDASRTGNQYAIIPPGQINGRPLGWRYYATVEEAKTAAIALINEKANSNAAHRWRTENQQKQFNSGHWEEPNVVAHVRFNDRDIPGVGKTAFIEEIQSDLHQQGADEGYIDPTAIKYQENGLPEGYTITERNSTHEAYGKWAIYKNGGYLFDGNDKEALIEQARKYAAKYGPNNSSNRVPNAPFKGAASWSEMMVKRMVRWAVKNGYDAIAVTPGKIQDERNDLSKEIERVEYDPDELWLQAYDHSGHRVIDERGVQQDELPDYIGKEAAQKLLEKVSEWQSDIHAEYDIYLDSDGKYKLSDENGDTVYNYGGEEESFNSHGEANDYIQYQKEQQRNAAPRPQLKGLDLKIGGKFHYQLYDEIIPNVLNKIGKRFGTKVETSKMPVKPGAQDISIQDEGDGEWWSVVDTDINAQEGPLAEFGTKEEAEAFVKTLGYQESVHLMKITPEMRESVGSEPFSLFNLKRKSGPDTQTLEDEYNRILERNGPKESSISMGTEASTPLKAAGGGQTLSSLLEEARRRKPQHVP